MTNEFHYLSADCFSFEWSFFTCVFLHLRIIALRPIIVLCALWSLCILYVNIFYRIKSKWKKNLSKIVWWVQHNLCSWVYLSHTTNCLKDSPFGRDIGKGLFQKYFLHLRVWLGSKRSHKGRLKHSKWILFKCRTENKMYMDSYRPFPQTTYL